MKTLTEHIAERLRRDTDLGRSGDLGWSDTAETAARVAVEAAIDWFRATGYQEISDAMRGGL